MYDSKKLAKILKVILYIIMLVLISVLFFLIPRFKSGSISGIELVHNSLINISVILILFFVKKIVDSIIKKSPFSINNIKYFKYIGYLFIFTAVVDLVSNIKNFTGTLVISIRPYFAIHFAFFLYLAFGLFSLILSQLFKEAYNLEEKNESRKYN